MPSLSGSESVSASQPQSAIVSDPLRSCLAPNTESDLVITTTGNVGEYVFGQGFATAASDPNVKQAFRTFSGRITNAALGCATGMVFLVIGGSRAWALPTALAATVLLSTYVVRVQVMWRQAPITAALIIAAGLTHHSELDAVEVGLRRVGEVMLGCVVGLAVTWLASKVWPPPEAAPVSPRRSGG